MNRMFVIIFMVLFFLNPVFPGSAAENDEGTEAFILLKDSPIFLSFETYKMKDGWTPVVLSVGELDVMLWLDASGRVTEMREPHGHVLDPVCFIDGSTRNLYKGADGLVFDVYEKNQVRTRWRLPSNETGDTLTQKILFREGGIGIDIHLGNLCMTLRHVYWNFQVMTPGFSRLQLNGPMVMTHQRLIYEKSTGVIYSTPLWHKPFMSKHRRAWAVKSGRSKGNPVRRELK